MPDRPCHICISPHAIHHFVFRTETREAAHGIIVDGIWNTLFFIFGFHGQRSFNINKKAKEAVVRILLN